MLINSSLLLRGIRPAYNQAMAEMNIDSLKPYEPAITRVPSNGPFETYAWLGAIPQLREWIGAKTVKSPYDWKYVITNKDFESTIGVDRNEVEDDQIGGIIPRVRTLAQKAIEFPHFLVSQLIVSGTSVNAYDGAAFFSSHTTPAGTTNNNVMAGTGITNAAIEADITSARSTMMTFTDDFGVVMGLAGDTVVVPPALELAFRKAIFSTTSFSQANPGVLNPFSGIIKQIVVDPYLTDTNDWYLLATAYPLRPLIYQERKAPIFVALDKPDTENVFRNKEFLYGVEMRGNAGFGFYQMAFKVTN